MWRTAQKGGAKDLMLMLDLNEAIHRLAMVIIVCLLGHLLSREGGNVWRIALEFEVEGQKRGRRGHG